MMIQFKKFWIKDGLQEDITQALYEHHDIPMHPSLLRSNRGIALLEECINLPEINFTNEEDAIKFFNLENKTDSQLDLMYLIRKRFCNFVVQNETEISKTISGRDLVRSQFNLVLQTLRHKHMILNEDYGFTAWFKLFIVSKIINKFDYGYAFAFIALCEFCPDFVCDDCYPAFNRNTASFTYSLELVFENEFMMKLFAKHIEKWHKYILTQR